MATGYSTSAILQPKQIVGVFSRVKPALRTLSTLFGFNVGGRNRTQYPGVGRGFSYDVFNASREVAGGRLPAQPSQEIAPQKVGEVSGTFPRTAEKMDLLDEKIHNQRVIGGPATTLDTAGESYITRQEMYMAQRIANVIEFQTAAMLRGKYYFTQSGDKLVHEFSSSGAAQTIDFKIPSGNLTTLNMLGGGALLSTWNQTADIPSMIYTINAAMQQLTGFTLENIALKSALWNTVVNNDYVVAQAGSSAQPFEYITKDGDGNFVAKLRSIPWLKWHILDHGLNIGTASGGTYTTLIETSKFFGFPDPSPEWCQYLEGGEVVTEGPGHNAPRGVQFGTYAYAYPRHDPSGWTMHSLLNGIPQLTVPAAVVYGDAS